MNIQSHPLHRTQLSQLLLEKNQSQKANTAGETNSVSLLYPHWTDAPSVMLRGSTMRLMGSVYLHISITGDLSLSPSFDISTSSLLSRGHVITASGGSDNDE